MGVTYAPISADDEPSGSAALTLRPVQRSAHKRAPIEASAPSSRFVLVDLAGRAILRIQLTGDEPTWLDPVLGRVKELSALAPDWDSYGGQPLTIMAVLDGLTLLSHLLPPQAPTPAVVPGHDGGLQFEWHVAAGDLEITVSPHGKINVGFVNAQTGQEWDIATGGGIDPRITSAISSL